MQSKAATVKQYLAELPADRRAALEAVRAVILKNLDKDYEEGMQYGMIGYYVPHTVFPAGYHCNPAHALPFAGLASQKNYMSLYMMFTYTSSGEETWLRTQWTKTGKKLDMGKCCIRFKKLDDLPLEVIGEAFRRVPVKVWIKQYQAARDSSARPAAKTGTTARSRTAKTAAKTARTTTRPTRRKA